MNRQEICNLETLSLSFIIQSKTSPKGWMKSSDLPNPPERVCTLQTVKSLKRLIVPQKYIYILIFKHVSQNLDIMIHFSLLKVHFFLA